MQGKPKFLGGGGVSGAQNKSRGASRLGGAAAPGNEKKKVGSVHQSSKKDLDAAKKLSRKKTTREA